MARGSNHLDVDRMIIDFLEYQAMLAVFDDYNNHRRAFKRQDAPPPVNSHSDIQLVDSFLLLFKAKHPHHPLEPTASFRLKLLQFSIVFIQRTVPNLAAPSEASLRAARITTASPSGTFTYSSSPSPLRSSTARQLPVEDEYRIVYLDRLQEKGATGLSPTLLDLQPLFLKLSAARTVLNGEEHLIKATWMQFAGEFMLQSAMEQIMVHGARDTHVLKEIFSWKWANLQNIDEMFEAQGHGDAEQWRAIRHEWASKLNPHPSRDIPLGKHLLEVARQYPLHKFQRRMLDFLEACHSDLATPVLIQAENGQIEGLSPEQTDALLRNSGLQFR